jgi:quercetin dioxygenase-like cupin family protein
VRILITGTDDTGRSCATFHGAPTFSPLGERFALAEVYSTGAPPGPRPVGHAQHHDLALPAGAVRWILVDYEPGAETPHHHTDSVDFEVVLSGSVVLTLDDGPHELHAGDAVVMTGVDHTWKAGPEGCRISAVCLGTPPRR